VNDQVLWYATRGAGTIDLVLLTGVVVLGILGVRRFEAPGWPRFLTTALHRNVALTAIALLVIHIVTAVVDPFARLGWTPVLIPFGSYYRTFWLGLGTIGAELMAAIVVTSLLRQALGQRTWRLVHWLAYAAWPLSLLHGVGTGTDTHQAWYVFVELVCLASAAVAVGVRLFGPRPDPLDEHRLRHRRRVTRDLPS
jgi:DMSO/TMAO reductase YedYZ heme-binding membrane subunit